MLINAKIEMNHKNIRIFAQIIKAQAFEYYYLT